MTWRANRSLRLSGFTLIELLVVLTILSLLIVLIPRLAQGLPGMRFRRDVSDLAAAFRGGHARALATGTTFRIRLDGKRLLWSDLSGASHHFSSGVTRLTVSLPGGTAADGGTVSFLPDGSATPAGIQLQGINHQAVISVNWITGDVRVDD